MIYYIYIINYLSGTKIYNGFENHTLKCNLFAIIFSLLLNGISPQTISYKRTPRDQVAADLENDIKFCFF